MGAGRLYWGQILAVLGVMLMGAVAATQWTASALGHQAALGRPDALILGEPLYAPWRFFLWWYAYDAYARSIFETGALIFVGMAAAAIALAFGFSLWRAREAAISSAYGSARWARRSDVARMGLSTGDGVILGAMGRKILRHDGEDHVLVVAPTNTGKSVGVALPTGLVWRDSYLALDLKGENWATTAGLRASFGPVFRFAPAEPDAHRFNPLTQIRRGDNEVRDAQILADMLVDPEGGLRERSHWQLRAFELLVAAILWTLYAEREQTLSRIAALLADPARPVADLLQDMLERPVKDGGPHPVVAAGARQLLDMAEGERSGVISTALGYLALYRDPLLARATAVSDFAIEDLVSGERPVSLYLVIPPEDLSRLKALLRLMLNQILKRVTETAGAARAGGRQTRRLLLLLDEFPQLGRLDFLEHALAYIRGYGVKACLIAQSLNQIAQAYGEHSSIIDNAHIRVAFACNDERTARRISDMLGVATETRAQMNYGGSRMSPWLGHAMVSRQEAPRPLLTPGEVMQLPAHEALILVGGAPPIRAQKLRYFDRPELRSRLRAPPAIVRTAAGVATPWDGAALLSAPIAARARPSSWPRRAGPPPPGRTAKTRQGAFDFGLPDRVPGDDLSSGAQHRADRDMAHAQHGAAPAPSPDPFDAALTSFDRSAGAASPDPQIAGKAPPIRLAGDDWERSQ